MKLEPGVEGLVHISELSHKRVFRVSDVVKEGQQVEVKVLSVDPENQRISLSMKAYEARPEMAKKSRKKRPRRSHRRRKNGPSTCRAVSAARPTATSLV